MKHRRKGCLLILLFAATLCLAFPWLWRQGVNWYYDSAIYTAAATPTRRVAIVFGAAVYGNDRLSPVLRDRVDTAVTLYQMGAVEKILMSGDNQFEDYNEPGAMVDYAVAQGVPPEDVQPDFGGRRTYDTCYRARYVFQVETAVLVTQEFHLPRALFTCRSFGIDAVGTSADLRPYRGARWYAVRETAATLVALWDVLRQEPPPVLGEPIPLTD